MFDDTFPHSAHNDSKTKYRFVLILNIERDFEVPELNECNREILQMANQSALAGKDLLQANRFYNQ